MTAVDYGDGEKQGNPSSPTTSPSYTFDAMGNRLSRTDSAAGTTSYAYNAANMLTASTGANASAYTPDADGDTLSGGGRSCAWDSQNRLTSCTLNGQTATFTYGADGLRRSMTAGGVTTDYVYDGQSMVEEMQGTPGSLHATATYLTGPMGPLCRVNEAQQTEGYYPPGVQSSAPLSRGVTRWYACDGLGSVVGEADFNGNLTCADEYDVYGAVRGRTGTATTAHGFCGSLGHLSDASTGLIYMRARYYDPSTGRFESEDPKHSGNNWFAYCDDNPTNLTDASGEDIDWTNDTINTVIAIILLWVATTQGTAIREATFDLGSALYNLGRSLVAGGSVQINTGSRQMEEGDEQDVTPGGLMLAYISQMSGGANSLFGAGKVALGVTLMSVGEYLQGSGLDGM